MLRKFVKSIPFAKSLYRWIMSDGTQSGELRAIKKYITRDSSPYFVDVGAHDGTSISNSAFFAKKGWTGLLFEPMPGPYSQLSEKYKNSHNVRCLNIACSDKKGIEDFFIGSDGAEGMLGTLCKDNNEWFKRARSEESIKVKVDIISDQLMENNFPNDFTLLLIDTEGMDYEVLLGMDFGLFQPRIIVTEEYKWNLEKHNSKYRLLENNGYRLKRLVGTNTIWVRE